MIICLTTYLIACILPLFISSWRVAFLGLAVQGLCIAILSMANEVLLEANSIVWLADLICLRLLAVPVLFFTLLREIHLKPDFDLIPSNLVAWILAFGLVILSLSLGRHLYPLDLKLTFHMGAVASSLLLGLLILSVQIEALGQMIGLLYIESSMTLFESLGEREPWFIQLSISLMFLWLLLLMGRLARKLQLHKTVDSGALHSEVI